MPNSKPNSGLVVSIEKVVLWVLWLSYIQCSNRLDTKQLQIFSEKSAAWKSEILSFLE